MADKKTATVSVRMSDDLLTKIQTLAVIETQASVSALINNWCEEKVAEKQRLYQQLSRAFGSAEGLPGRTRASHSIAPGGDDA